MIFLEELPLVYVEYLIFEQWILRNLQELFCAVMEITTPHIDAALWQRLDTCACGELPVHINPNTSYQETLYPHSESDHTYAARLF